MISFLSLKDEESLQLQELKYDYSQPQFMLEYEEESIDFLGNINSQPLLSGQHYDQGQTPENVAKKEDLFENFHFDKFEYCQFSIFPNEHGKMHGELHDQYAEQLATMGQISKVKRNNLSKGKRIVSIEWNKQHKYIEVSYFKEEKVLFSGNENAKINCGEQQSEIQAGPSLTEITTIQSLQHTKSSSISSSSSPPAQIEEQCGISVFRKQKHIDHHLDSSFLESAFKDFNCQNSNIFCCSNYFQLPQETQQSSVPMIHSTLINTEFLKFLTNQELSELTSNNLALSLFPFDFQYFLNLEKERKPFQIYQDIFKEIESFQEGHIASKDHLSFITKDGFIFTAQCLWQVFPFRDDNNLLVGCIIKEIVLVLDHMIEKIAQQRQSQLNQDEQIEKQPKISSLIKEVLKLKVKHKQVDLNQEEESKQSFERSVRNFLYKFKYIQKQKRTLSILDQDRFPSKTCKYRILTSLKKSHSSFQ